MAASRYERIRVDGKSIILRDPAVVKSTRSPASLRWNRKESTR